MQRNALIIVIVVLLLSCTDKANNDALAESLAAADGGDAATTQVTVMGPERSPTPCACGYLWEKRFGNDRDGFVAANGLATDAVGNVVAVGSFRVSVDFGGGAFASPNGDDVFAAKLGPGGEHIWSKRFGDAESQKARTVVVADDGSIYMAGELRGAIDFGGGPLLAAAGEPQTFVVKLDAQGNQIWSKVFESKLEIAVASIVVSGADIVLAGRYKGTIDFGGGPLKSGGNGIGEAAIFVAKLGGNGSHIWSKSFAQKNSFLNGSGGFGLGVADVRVDAKGSVIIAGSFRDAIDFGGGVLTADSSVPNEGTDGYVMKLDVMGNHVWSKRLGSPREDSVTGVAISAAGDVFVSGNGGLEPKSGGGIFMTRFDPSGTLQWARSFVGAIGAKLAHDRIGGRLAITGAYTSQKPVDFGCGQLRTAAEVYKVNASFFAAVFDEVGRCEWSIGAGTDDFDNRGTQVTYDSSGNLLVSGTSSEGMLDVGGGSFTARGISTLLVKFGP